jgi:hypothetical protein
MALAVVVVVIVGVVIIVVVGLAGVAGVVGKLVEVIGGVVVVAFVHVNVGCVDDIGVVVVMVEGWKESILERID